MFTIFKDFTFSAAHAIRGHTGGCENLHGHNYRVRVHVAAEKLDALGMVVDFADLKAVMAEVLEPFDHRVINEIEPFTERNTTAELFSHYVFEQVSVGLVRQLREADDDPQRVRVQRVEVWENDRSCAMYEA
jgi:6-pyruvoyltetrahydropterin/6-carboxytetrahydropterin synthase